MEMSSPERPRERRVLFARHALKAAEAGQAWKYLVSHAARTVLDPEISPRKIRCRRPAEWLMNRKRDRSSPEP
jgi:hypothetical protein